MKAMLVLWFIVLSSEGIHSQVEKIPFADINACIQEVERINREEAKGAKQEWSCPYPSFAKIRALCVETADGTPAQNNPDQE